MRIFLALMFQQIRLGWRGGKLFWRLPFCLSPSPFAFGIGPELRLLKELAPGWSGW